MHSSQNVSADIFNNPALSAEVEEGIGITFGGEATVAWFPAFE